MDKGNLHVSWTVAKERFEETGRGALVVDTASRPTGEGNPFGYFPQEALEEGGDEEIKRIVDEYNLESEFVVMVIKSD
jgi:hypothetical protein